MAHQLVEEAMRKAAIAWVSVDGAPATLVWCLPAEGALWVVTGPGEQDLPGLPAADQVMVSLRGDHGGRIVTFPATVTRLDPASDEWSSVVPQLAGKRLNAPLAAEALAARWASECTVSRLSPAGDPTGQPDGGQAEPVRETPARRRTRTPFHLHRVRRPRR